MRYSLIAGLIGVVLGNSGTALANQPPPPKTLAERVELATHVIVGTAETVRVMEVKDGKSSEMKPEPKLISPGGQFIEVDIQVQDVLYPLGWKPKTVGYLFGDGWFDPKDVRADTVGKKYIYLMRANPYPDQFEDGRNMYLPSYGWHLADSLDSAPAIQATLDARVKRETDNKAKGG